MSSSQGELERDQQSKAGRIHETQGETEEQNRYLLSVWEIGAVSTASVPKVAAGTSTLTPVLVGTLGS